MTASQHSLAVGQSWESSFEPGVKLINMAVGLLHSGGSEQVLQLTRELEQLKATNAALRVELRAVMQEQQERIASLEERWRAWSGVGSGRSHTEVRSERQ